MVGDPPSEKRARQGLKISFHRSPVSRFLIKVEYRNISPSAKFGQDDFRLRERRKVPFPSLSTDPRWPAAVVPGAVVRLRLKGTVRQCPSLLLERSDSTRSGRQLFSRPFLRAAALRSSSPSPSLPHAVTMPDLKLDFSPSFPPSFPSTKMRNSSAAWKGKKGSQVQVFPFQRPTAELRPVRRRGERVPCRKWRKKKKKALLLLFQHACAPPFFLLPT